MGTNSEKKKKLSEGHILHGLMCQHPLGDSRIDRENRSVYMQLSRVGDVPTQGHKRTMQRSRCANVDCDSVLVVMAHYNCCKLLALTDIGF